MKIIKVDLGARNYDIVIEPGLLKSVGGYVERLKTSGIAVITDSNVWELYGGAFSKAMEASSLRFSPIILHPGEQSKTLSVLDGIFESLGRAGIRRDGLILAFGGGVVGDAAGFAAATWNRGINYVQIPTTLLAQVDSSIGGKTAVNVPAGKNLVGAFHQPKMTLIDTGLLSTLTPGEFRCGMAEVIKSAAIRSAGMFEKLEGMAESFSGLSSGGTVNPLPDLSSGRSKSVIPIDDMLSDIICECCEIKKDIVSRDEFDSGERMLLNFGHTFGHAIEKRGKYTKYNHGEAVAMGMVIAAELGECVGETEKGSVARVKGLLESYGLSTESPYHPGELLADVKLDKKSGDFGISLALIRRIGEAFLKQYSFQELQGIVEQM